MTVSFAAQILPGNPALPQQIQVSDQTTIQPSSGSTSFDGIYTSAGTVTSGSNVTIDVSLLKDPAGNSISVDRIVGIKISNKSIAGNLTHGGGTSPIYAAQPLAIGPGDVFAQTLTGTSLAVNGAYGKNLLLSADVGTISYVVTILTRSA